jgi:hypothetical protein
VKECQQSMQKCQAGVPAANLGGAGVSAEYAEVSGRGASSEFRGC